jgi:hypothetical protein
MKQTLSHPSTKNLPAKVIQSYKSTFLPNIIQRAIPIKQISQAINEPQYQQYAVCWKKRAKRFQL